MLYRVVKQYPNGIIESDKVNFNSSADALKWVNAVNSNHRAGFTVLDYERAVVDSGSIEIIDNPTGGYVGNIGVR